MQSLHALALSSLAFAAPLPSNSVELRHAPEVETPRRLTFQATSTLDGGELTVTMNGSEVPAMFLPDLHLEAADEMTLEIVDSVSRQSASGAPALWERTFETVERTYEGSMSMTTPGEGEESTPWAEEGETGLEGESVRFWVEEDGSIGRESVSGECAGDVLSALRPGLGFVELLPEEPVEVGATWEVSGEHLELLWELNRELSFEFSEESRVHLYPEFTSRSFGGELRLTLVSASAGRARVEVEGELERKTVSPGDLSQVPVVDGTATDTTTDTWEVSGELTWDVSANALAAFSIEGELLSERITVRDPGQGGADYSSSFSVEGTQSLQVEGRADGSDA